MRRKLTATAVALITLAASIAVINNSTPAEAVKSAPAAITTAEVVETTTVTTTSETTASIPVKESEPVPKTEPMTIKLHGESISFKNTSIDELQPFINEHVDMAGTYYGSSFNGADGLPTHFAGHDYGKFGVIKKSVVGDEVVVTDEHGTEFTYVVSETRLMTVLFQDGAGYTQSQADTDFMLAQMNAGTEMVYLQTCASEVTNGSFDVFFVVAYPK